VIEKLPLPEKGVDFSEKKKNCMLKFLIIYEKMIINKI